MSRSILEELTAPTQFTQLDWSRLSGRVNTLPRKDLYIRSWSAWEDFTYDNIIAIFGQYLSQTYRGDREPRLVPADTVQFNEATTHNALNRIPIATVNHALAEFSGAPHYGDGGRVPIDARSRPDWSAICDPVASGEYDTKLVGDTKVSSKWRPGLIRDDMSEWHKPVNQVAGYMAAAQCRYGFIVTDAVLVVLRVRRKDTGIGLAADPQSRPSRRRGKGVATYKEDSDTSVGETIERSSPPYQDDSPSNWNLLLEHAVIYWDPAHSSRRGGNSSHGGRLTPKLALWALAMMASYGDSDIDYDYPGLNTWRKQSNGFIIHNTSGAQLEGPRAGCIMQERGVSGRSTSSGNGRAEASGSGHGQSSGHGESGSRGRSGDSSGAEYVLPRHEVVPPVPQLPQQARSFASSSTQARPPSDCTEVRVTVQGRKVCFRDYKGELKMTYATEWKKIDGGFIYRGKKHNYLTKSIG